MDEKVDELELIHKYIQDLREDMAYMVKSIGDINHKLRDTGVVSRAAQDKPIISERPKEVVVRLGTEMLFSYPDETSDYDTIVSLEVYPSYIKIIERSQSRRASRTHLVMNMDMVSWV